MIEKLWFSVVSVCLVVPILGVGCADVPDVADDGSDGGELVAVEAALRARPKLAVKPKDLAASATFATAAGKLIALGHQSQATSANGNGNKDGKPDEPDDDTGGDTGDDDTGDTGDDNPTDCYNSGTTTTSCQHGGQTCRCTFNYLCDEENGDCVCASVLVSVDCGGGDLPVIESPR